MRLMRRRYYKGSDKVRNIRAVSMGTLVQRFDGKELWVVTGWRATTKQVFVSVDNCHNICTAEELGFEWEHRT